MLTTNYDWLSGNHEALYDKAKRAVVYLTESTNRMRVDFDLRIFKSN